MSAEQCKWYWLDQIRGTEHTVRARAACIGQREGFNGRGWSALRRGCYDKWAAGPTIPARRLGPYAPRSPNTLTTSSMFAQVKNTARTCASSHEVDMLERVNDAAQSRKIGYRVPCRLSALSSGKHRKGGSNISRDLLRFPLTISSQSASQSKSEKKCLLTYPAWTSKPALESRPC